MIRRPPRSTRTDTLFPYTALFRSTAKFFGACDAHSVSVFYSLIWSRGKSWYKLQVCSSSLTAVALADCDEWRHAAGVAPHQSDFEGPAAAAIDGPVYLHDYRRVVPLSLSSEERRVGKACVGTCRSRW